MTTHVDPKYLEKAVDAHAIVSIADASGNITHVNQKFCDISGYTMAELLGHNHRMLKSGVHLPSFYQKIWDTLLSGESWHGDICNQRKNGERYWVNASITPILNGNPLATQYVSIRTDISEIKRIEEKLLEANVQLEAYRIASEYDLELARALLERITTNASSPTDNVEFWIQPATQLSGDLVITHNFHDERSYILLADAMGHGLPAALQLIPIVQTFSKMAQKGSTVSAIIREMNQAISVFTPVGQFVAVTLLSVDCANRLIHIWNGGNPTALLTDDVGAVLHKFKSHHLALGISRGDDFDSRAESIHWENDCWITIFSDGLTDAESVQGEAFGDDRIMAALHSHEPHQSLKEAVLDHLDGQEGRDDISIATIRFLGKSNGASVHL